MEPALIALIGAVVGVLLTNGIKLVLDVRARMERVRDIQTALRAEIRSHRQSLDVFLDEQRAATVTAQIMQEPGFMPFLPHESDPFIFDSLVADVAILPGKVIDPLVLYYSQRRTFAGSLEDMRQAGFLQLGPERRAAIYADCLAIAHYTAELANDAIAAITRSLADQDDDDA